MELRDFVRESLCQILAGVEDAQRAATHSVGPLINPNLHQGGTRGMTKEHPLTDQYGAEIVRVQFDVAVTAAEKASHEGKAGVEVFAVGLGGKMASEKESGTVSRISFAVPITFAIRNNLDHPSVNAEQNRAANPIVPSH